MSWSKTLDNALAAKDIPEIYSEWAKLAADRLKWREFLSKVSKVLAATG